VLSTEADAETPLLVSSNELCAEAIAVETCPYATASVGEDPSSNPDILVPPIDMGTVTENWVLVRYNLESPARFVTDQTFEDARSTFVWRFPVLSIVESALPRLISYAL
jgi:hypothetical protein